MYYVNFNFILYLYNIIMITKSVYKSNIILNTKDIKILNLIKKLHEINTKEQVKSNIKNLLDKNTEHKQKNFQQKLDYISTIKEDTYEELEIQYKKLGYSYNSLINIKYDVYENEINKLLEDLNFPKELIYNIKNISNILKNINKKYNFEKYFNIFDKVNLYDNYIEYSIKNKYGNKCNYDGYVLKDEIKLIKRSYAKILYNGTYLYSVSYIANILLPTEGTFFSRCEIINTKDNFGFIATPKEYPTQIVVFVPFNFLNEDMRKKILNKEINIINIVTLSSYFEIHDDFIKIIGIPNKQYNYSEDLEYDECLTYFKNIKINDFKVDHFDINDDYYIENLKDEDLQPSNVDTTFNQQDTQDVDIDSIDGIDDIYSIDPVNTIIDNDKYKYLIKSLDTKISLIFNEPELYYRFKNYGATCHLNSTLQLLNRITTLKKSILDFNNVLPQEYYGKTMKLLKNILREENTPELDLNEYNNNTKNLLQLIKGPNHINSNPIDGYETRHQEDSAATLGKILEMISTSDFKTKTYYDLRQVELDHTFEPKDNIENFVYDDVINTIEQNILKDIIILEITIDTCKNCKLIEFRVSSQNTIFIKKNKVSKKFNILESLLNNEEDIDMTCPLCNKNEFKRKTFYKFNKYVLVDIDRSIPETGEYDNENLIEDLNENISNIPNLEFGSTDIVNYVDSNIKLNLRSMICKDGTADTGHYINISKDINERWVAHNDFYKSIIQDGKGFEHIDTNFNNLTKLILFRVNKEDNKSEELLENDLYDIYDVGLPVGVGIPIMGGTNDDIDDIFNDIQDQMNQLLEILEIEPKDLLREKIKDLTSTAKDKINKERYKIDFDKLQVCRNLSVDKFKKLLNDNQNLKKYNWKDLYDFVCEVNDQIIKEETFITTQTPNQTRITETESDVRIPQTELDVIIPKTELDMKMPETELDMRMPETELVQTTESRGYDDLTNWYVPNQQQQDRIFIGTQGYEFNKELKNNYWNKCFEINHNGKNILDFYSEHFKVLEMNSKITNFKKLNNILDDKTNKLEKISLVINITEFTQLSGIIDMILKNKIYEGILIILKFDKLEYNPDIFPFQLIKKLENVNLYILFEFLHKSYYNNDLLNYIYKIKNFNIVLIDFNEKENIITFINQDEDKNIIKKKIFQEIIKKDIIYIKLYGSKDLYQGSYENLDSIKQKFENLEDKDIYYIFGNVKTNTENKLFSEMEINKPEKKNKPSSISNAITLITSYQS